MKQMCIFLIYGLISFFLQNPLLAQSSSGNCGTPMQLQATVTGNQVNFSWTGTNDADIHVVLLYNKTTKQNDKGFSVVGKSLSTTLIPNGSYRWRVIALCNTRNSLTDHSEWIWGEDFDFSGNCPVPSSANAGADQLNISGTNTVLTATNPVTGTGAWTIVSGTGGSFGNTSNPSSTFIGAAGSTYVLRWTVSNECDSNYDEATVSFSEKNYLNPNLAYGTVTDIDGNQYATIKIGMQTWMAENLRTTKYSDGTLIPNIIDAVAWTQLTTGAWSYYDNDATHNYPLGKLYNWYAVNTGKLCPQGWHIPSDEDWTILKEYLGGSLVAGGKMKSIIDWSEPNADADNWSGYSGLSGGTRGSDGIFYNITGNSGFWWSSTVRDILVGYKELYYNSGNLYDGEGYKGNALNCRCIKDCPTLVDANAGADQLNISGTNTVLTATNPVTDTGAWTIVSGTGGSFGNISNPSSTFIGAAGSTYVLRWTVSNECSSNYDEVTVSFCTPVSLSDAGADQVISSGTSATLSATLPSIGTGAWTIVSGTGGSFSNASSAVSSFTGLAHTTYELCWTVSNACQNSSDTVMITFCTPPVNASFVLKGYLPTGDYALKGALAEGEIGTWSVIEGEGGYFSDIHDPESSFRGQLNTPYLYKIKWTVSNACGSIDSESTFRKRTKYNNPYLNPNLEYGSVTDIEGHEYPTIQIGNQTWMAENLRTTSSTQGKLFVIGWTGGLLESLQKWPAACSLGGAYNYGSSGQLKDTADGVYYPYGVAINTRLCPIGWRVPDDKDGRDLYNYLGGSAAGDKMKAVGKWSSGSATNESGFSAIPSGFGRGLGDSPTFTQYGNQAVFMTNEYISTGLLGYAPVSLRLDNIFHNGATLALGDFKGIAPCRCIKDDCTRTLIADAGQDTLNIRKSNIFIYAGKLPKYGHGEWSIVSGIGGNIIDEGIYPVYQGARIGFEGTTNTEYVLRWTVSNDCGNSVYDERTVSFCPKLASAGADQSKVTGTITLAATAPEDGTGIWTIVSGIGGSFGNASQPSSTFTGTAGNIYVLRWTVNDKCGSNYDEVIVSYCPQLVSAGADQSKIAGTVTTLAATVPEDGTGIWTIRSGTGGSLSNASQSNSTFTGTAGSTYVLRWTVNDKCGISYDEVSVSYCPKLASAGTDQLEVTGTVTTLAASVPVNGTGAWTIESGIGGSFGNASQPNSTFTGTAGNIYVLRWTVSNVCGSNYDEVTVSFMPVSVTDIDGNQYGVVKIGNQIWMSENLRTTKYNDGAIIQNVTDNSGWGLQRTGGWSYYNNEVSNNYPYGKLYNWYAVNTGKLCPQGWHIPMDMEWTVLTDYLGGLTVAGGKMKLTTGWNAPNTGATNESGFSGVAGGRRDHLGMFYVLGRASYWWSNTETSESPVTIRQLGSDNSSVIVGNNSNKIHGFSCRCIKD